MRVISRLEWALSRHGRRVDKHVSAASESVSTIAPTAAARSAGPRSRPRAIDPATSPTPSRSRIAATPAARTEALDNVGAPVRACIGRD